MTWFNQLMKIEKDIDPTINGILSDSEVKFIEENLTIPEDEFMLKNLRDMTVLVLGKVQDLASDMKDQVRFNKVYYLISGIISIIDDKLNKLGCKL